jgi:DNA-binding HxlR family transcriptional regulator
MFRGKSSYNALLKSSESISTNILANRLLKLEQHGLLNKTRDPDNKKQFIYTLTEKGFDLIPVMLKLTEHFFFNI